MHRLKLLNARLRPLGIPAVTVASWMNLALVPTWRALFDPTRTSSMGGRISVETYAAAGILVVGAALAGTIAASLAHQLSARAQRRIGDAALLCASGTLGLVFWRETGGMLTTAQSAVRSLGLTGVALGSIATLAVAVIAVRHWRLFMRLMGRGLLVLSPFLLFTVGFAGIALSRTDIATLNNPVAPANLTAARAGVRLVIIVFDELDYTHSYGKRPPGLMLPNFDRLRHESVFAVNALPPASASALSLPSYILGRVVTTIQWRKPTSQGVRFDGDSIVHDLVAEQTIFHDAAGLGARSELVGAYLPYCRLPFASLLVRCTWRPLTWGGVFDGEIGVGRAAVRQLLAVFAIGNRREHISRIEELSAAAVRAVADPGLRLVFLHLPVPHLPPVWDAQKHRYTQFQLRESAYFDMLELADIHLGRILAVMDHDATAALTYLIVTSDHPWRAGSIAGRQGGGVPFLIRTPSRVPIEVTTKVLAVRLRALSWALLSGSLTTSTDIATWLQLPAGDH